MDQEKEIKVDKDNEKIETVHDDQIASELFDIIILNELLKKGLLVEVADYVKEFEKQTAFDYSQPFSFIDFLGFIHKKNNLSTELKFKQFLLNLELFAIKLYRLTEISKKHISGTNLKKLRQAYAHRKSSDILEGKERLVIFGGMTYDLNVFFIENIGSKGQSSERIDYFYSKYIDILLEYYSDLLSNKAESVVKFS